MRKMLSAFALFALTQSAQAQSEVELKLGKADPQPEALAVFSDELRVGARIVMDIDESLATAVHGTDVMALQFGFWTDEAADGPAKLICKASFVMADGTKSKVIKEGVCFEGDLKDFRDSWTQSNWVLKFHNTKTDIVGTAAVMLTVTDEVSGDQVVLAPTYRWLGME